MWQTQFDAYARSSPELAAEFTRRVTKRLPVGFRVLADAILRGVHNEAATLASRKASQHAIGRLARALPELLGGSADLTHSNLTDWPDCGAVRADQAGRHINWGVREFGMAAALNGIALHGGYLTFGATFLVFSDYARNAMRMSALMRQRVVYVMTHDSIGLGEDGPTHQPVEHLPSLRQIPNLDVWRPCDAVETQAAWNASVMRADGPSVIACSRQNLPHQARDAERLGDIARGGYVLAEADDGQPAMVLIATGSEVALAMEARARLQADGIATRVVSMPCTAAFDRQAASWRDAVLPADVPRVAIEAAQPDGWWKYLAGAPRATVIGIDRFGESAPAGELATLFGMTPERIVDTARRLR